MTAAAARPDLGAYRRFVVAFSGGKDSLAALLHLLRGRRAIGCSPIWRRSGPTSSMRGRSMSPSRARTGATVYADSRANLTEALGIRDGAQVGAIDETMKAPDMATTIPAPVKAACSDTGSSNAAPYTRSQKSKATRDFTRSISGRIHIDWVNTKGIP